MRQKMLDHTSFWKDVRHMDFVRCAHVVLHSLPSVCSKICSRVVCVKLLAVFVDIWNDPGVKALW
jgi:hypothetical protein